MKENPVKFNIKDLPLYTDPSVIKGDKAKFYYDKDKKDCVIVDILEIENINTGYYIFWSFEHDKTKSFRTFMRRGSVGGIELDWVEGSTVTKKMIKCFTKPHQAKPNKIKC